MGEVPAIFGGGARKVGHSLTKTNGLGHYLLTKTQFAMQKDGLLSVGKSGSKDGQYVFINSHAIGLSNRLEDFDNLASKQADYQKSLQHLTVKLPKHKKRVSTKKIYAAAPEWEATKNSAVMQYDSLLLPCALSMSSAQAQRSSF